MYVRLLAGQGPAFIYPSVNVWIEGNNEAPCGHSSVTTAVQLLLPTPTHRNCLYTHMEGQADPQYLYQVNIVVFWYFRIVSIL